MFWKKDNWSESSEIGTAASTGTEATTSTLTRQGKYSSFQMLGV